MTPPLLSICVPTFNRSARLRVMLESVLPQVPEQAGKVEVLISDNSSPDDTPRVVEDARRLGPLRYSRNATNIGLVANFIRSTERASGEYVWILGDDDLLRPGALARVVRCLEAHPVLNLFYLNFRQGRMNPHWPESAVGGYEGSYDEVINTDTSDRPLRHWHEVVSARNSMGGQGYVHVLRRGVWLKYWKGRPRQSDFSDPRWSYPHGVMIAETLMHEPSYYLGEPVLTIFNGGQSWIEQRHSVVFNFPGLLYAYRKNGLPQEQTRECERMAFSQCEPLLAEVLKGEAGRGALTYYLKAHRRRMEAWKALARASLKAGRPRVAVWAVSLALRLRGILSQ